MWQDVAAAILGGLLGIFIWPMIYRIWQSRDVRGHSLATALPTAALLGSLAVVYWSAGLQLTGLVHVVSSTAWFLVALLIWRHRKQPSVKRPVELEPGITMEEFDGLRI